MPWTLIARLHALACLCSFAGSFVLDRRTIRYGVSTLGSAVESKSFELSTGVSMLVEYSIPTASSKPTLLFLHGSFHGSWCWSEKFFSYFDDYPVIALNWRGTGGTPAGEGVKKVKVAEHVADLDAFLDQILPQLVKGSGKPVVICHSFGGIALMKYLESHGCDRFSGIVTMCSVPPSGNGKMTLRFLQRSLIVSWKITAGFALKRCIQNPVLCRELFFGGPKEDLNGTTQDYGVSDEDITRYQSYFERDSAATIDLIDLGKQLPSSVTVSGKAPFVRELPPCLVLGATDDKIVDKEGLQETADYFGLSKYELVDAPHDVMLGAKWENSAKLLDEWVSTCVTS